jgi:hypothetical protein
MLTEMQKKFADLFVQTDGRDAAACAEMAGYGSPKQRAYELLHNDEVLEEIRRLVSSRFCAALARAETKIEEIMDDDEGSKGRAVQLKAAQAVIAHGGLLLERLARLDIHHHVQPRDELSLGNRLAAVIVRMMPKLGLAVVDQAKFDRYIAGLNASEQPLTIDVTPQPVVTSEDSNEC